MLGISLLLATFACRKQEEEPAVLASPVKGVAASSGNLKAGMPAPELDFEQVLQAPEGTKANWETLRGKAVVLEFWATWCGPCVAAIPHLNELAEKYAGKPLQFISITNEKEDTVAKFLKRKPIKAWVGLDTKQTVSRAYGVSGIPVTVLVDAQGKLAGFTYPTQVTEKVLDDLLAGRPLAGMETPAGGKSIRPGVEPVADEAAPPPLFQVVIRPFAGEAGGSMLSGDGRLTLNGVGIASAIPYAYGVPSYRTDIACELPEAKYDVTVLLPLGNEKQLEPLLRQALEMTFGLKTRQETRTRDAYELVVAEGGPKLTATVMDAGAGSSSRGGLGVLELINATTDSLASNLANRLNRPVFDQTGQASRYDMSLSWDEEEAGGLAVEVRAQLGLELKPVQRAVEMLVVEKVAGS
jgi:uncharacterized protein (TIGR03435 family)